MAHAERLDPDRAAGWLHVVVKREAHAIRRSRQKLVGPTDVDLDTHQARSVPTPDEQLATFDLIGRSAEALQRLKPQELRALWLRAQGVRNQRRCNDCLRRNGPPRPTRDLAQTVCRVTGTIRRSSR